MTHGHPEVLQENISCCEEGLQGRCQENKDKSELLVLSECVFKERGTLKRIMKLAFSFQIKS